MARGKVETTGFRTFSLYKDQLGGWSLSWYDSDTGDEEHRSASSQSVARRFAKAEWGVLRWSNEDGIYRADEAEPNLPKCLTCGSTTLYGAGDGMVCCENCGNEWDIEELRNAV